MGANVGTPLDRQKPPYKLTFQLHLCPGDTMALTMVTESIHRQFPGEYLTDVDAVCGEDIFKHNSRITKMSRGDTFVFHVDHPLIQKTNQFPCHFADGMCLEVAKKIGRPEFHNQVNRPYLYLTDEEKAWTPPWPQPYVLGNFGFKKDYTAKYPGRFIWQQAVDYLVGRGVTVVQVGGSGDIHPCIDGAVDMVGQTTPRRLFQMASKAAFGLGPVSFLLHVFAAFHKPYIAMAGGREVTAWTEYPSVQHLNTLGMMPCCETKACWKSRTVALDDEGWLNKSLCEMPVKMPDGEAVPACHAVVGSYGIMEAARRILDGRQMFALPLS